MVLMEHKGPRVFRVLRVYKDQQELKDLRAGRAQLETEVAMMRSYLEELKEKVREKEHAILGAKAHVNTAIGHGTIRHELGAQEAYESIMEFQTIDINVQVFPEIVIVDFEGRLRLSEHLFIDSDGHRL